MNEEFKNYVRESAFNLTLSTLQIKVLLSMADIGVSEPCFKLSPYQALMRRGLIVHIKDKGFKLTKEGEIVCDLLVCAGYVEVEGYATKTN